MDVQQIVRLIVEQLQDHPCIEGVFLAGSLINEDQDAFSDIDLGIASGNSAADLERAYALARPIMSAVGTPVHFIERGWDQCKMIAILYGKSAFPPVGLEVDLVFSQLQHVSEQMPYADYVILFDRRGGLKRELDRMGRKRPPAEIAAEIRQHLRGYPFLVHDALKALGRSDWIHFQSLLEGMRVSFFAAAAAQRGKLFLGTKRAFKVLSAAEQEVIEASYREFSREIVGQLAALFVESVTILPATLEIEDEIDHLRAALREL